MEIDACCDTQAPQIKLSACLAASIFSVQQVSFVELLKPEVPMNLFLSFFIPTPKTHSLFLFLYLQPGAIDYFISFSDTEGLKRFLLKQYVQMGEFKCFLNFQTSAETAQQQWNQKTLEQQVLSLWIATGHHKNKSLYVSIFMVRSPLEANLLPFVKFVAYLSVACFKEVNFFLWKQLFQVNNLVDLSAEKQPSR